MGRGGGTNQLEIASCVDGPNLNPFCEILYDDVKAVKAVKGNFGF